LSKKTKKKTRAFPKRVAAEKAQSPWAEGSWRESTDATRYDSHRRSHRGKHERETNAARARVELCEDRAPHHSFRVTHLYYGLAIMGCFGFWFGNFGLALHVMI